MEEQQEDSLPDRQQIPRLALSKRTDLTLRDLVDAAAQGLTIEQIARQNQLDPQDISGALHTATQLLSTYSENEAPQATQDVIRVCGAWNDLDWETMEQELFRIRHENKPSPTFGG